MKIIIIIPARYSSSRFPGKPLADLCGKPMIWWVYNQAKKVKCISDVLVATDDERIQEKCDLFNLKCVMTDKNNSSSTERAFEVAKKYPADLYIVVNGDEPLIDPRIIESIIPTSLESQEPIVYNLMTKIHDPVQALDPSNIKVVVDSNNNALLFTRSLIPYPKSSLDYSFFKHVGVLAYNFKALQFFVETKKGYLELAEDINELRFVENGVKVRMVCVDCNTLSVDTPKDLDYIKSILSGTQR